VTPDVFPLFDEYEAAMRPIVLGLTRKSTRPHPYIGKDDLVQEALISLFDIWQRYRRTVPTPDDLKRMGSRAIRRRLTDAWRRTRWFGEGASVSVPLARTQRAPEDDVSTQLALLDLERQCPHERDRRVLQELVTPSFRTRSAARRGYRDAGAIAVALGWSSGEVLARMATLRGLIHRAIRPSPDALVPDALHSPNTRQEGTMAKTQPNELPDADLLGEMAVAIAEDAPAATRKPKRVRVRTSRATPKPTEQPEGAKPDKKASRKGKDKKGESAPAREKAPRKEKGRPKSTRNDARGGGPVTWMAKEYSGPKLAVGTPVRYEGGSRAAWLKKGAEGVVAGYYGNKAAITRYDVKFGDDKRTTLSAHFITKK
jgi:DNA-directed RNA polymerase specialized sigma24 family protein